MAVWWENANYAKASVLRQKWKICLKSYQEDRYIYK